MPAGAVPEDRAAHDCDRSLADRSETPSCPPRAPCDAAKRPVGSQAFPGLVAPGTLPMASGQPTLPPPAPARSILRLIEGVGGVAADRLDPARIDTAVSRCRVPLRSPP